MSIAHTLRAWLASTAFRAFAALTALTLAGALASSAWAQEDPPGRVGRLADVDGGVSWFDHESGTWGEVERNRPITSGDRLSTRPDGRVELRVGSTVLRVGASTELEVLRLDDERLVFQLHTGSLALRVRSREKADELEIITGEARLLPLRAGHYRIDRSDDSTLAGAWRGALRIDDPAGFTLEAGQRAELWREGPGRRDANRDRRALRFAWTALPNDGFAQWVTREDAQDERSASNRYVSPEMTGAEELDRHGRWDRHPEYGAIWYPTAVSVGWAPYRYGRWAWVRPWGWTWVDDSRWGFAPFHYGRWVSWNGRWGWCPGEYVARPVYAPALVAWIDRPGVSVSINIGGPSVGWVPLAPREWYVPQYRHTPVYVERVNPRGPGWQGQPPRQVPTGPIMYGNQGVPGAVTVVPRDVLQQRQPVGRAVMDIGPVAQQPRQGWVTVQPPQREARREERREDRREERRDERRDDRRDDRQDDRREQRDERREERREDRREDRRDDRRTEPPRMGPISPLPQAQPQAPQPPVQAQPAGPVIDLRRERPAQGGIAQPPAQETPRPVLREGGREGLFQGPRPVPQFIPAPAPQAAPRPAPAAQPAAPAPAAAPAQATVQPRPVPQAVQAAPPPPRREEGEERKRGPEPRREGGRDRERDRETR